MGPTPARAYRRDVRIAVLALLLAALLAPAARAAEDDSPAAAKRVVREWSQRLNAYDNAGVARLFARPAIFVQNADPAWPDASACPPP